MDVVLWQHRPKLRRPLLLVAFEGWNDAGDAATLALDYLAEAWGATRFASIDPEEFYDFTSTRPTVRLAGDGLSGENGNRSRAIEWPEVQLLAASVPGVGRDVVLVRGVEPQLRWRTFCAALVEVAETVGAELAVILGALLADVPHTRPVRVSGTTEDRELAGRLGLRASTYEGETGIVGVLHDAFSRAGLPSTSFWAAVPHYVHQVPSPKAALALVERSAALIGARVNPLELQVAAEEYERRVSERVADDEDAAEYVSQLEAADDDSDDDPADGDRLFLGDPEALAAEVERFLREHRPDG